MVLTYLCWILGIELKDGLSASGLRETGDSFTHFHEADTCTWELIPILGDSYPYLGTHTYTWGLILILGNGSATHHAGI